MLETPHTGLGADSFLEYAFLRWVLTPATLPQIVARVEPQAAATIGERHYRLDYEIVGDEQRVAVELDGFQFHSSRGAFTYDRLRQNDLQASGRSIVRFSYDAIRTDVGRCVAQLQAVLALDPSLAALLVSSPVLETPEMDPDPIHALAPPPGAAAGGDQDDYFASVAEQLNQATLRDCQSEAFAALANYYGGGGNRAACVMAVGAGKTALGVAATLAFTRRRAMVVTPGSVIRGTFDRAFDPEALGNVLNGLPGGPLIPGQAPPRVLTLDRNFGPIGEVTREELLASDVIVTNFHSLGDGESPGDLLAKIDSGDVDFIVVDEAHIAAADSYQRTFAHFADARTLLMSACFQRLDGKPIDADVVYRYRLIDSIVDGNAKNLRVHRFAPDVAQTTYEMVWPDGSREEIVGRDALLELLGDERKLARVTAKSTEPMRQVMRVVRDALEGQAALLAPVKPRVLFSALGELHAAQIAEVANEFGIPAAHLHHSMGEAQIRETKARFESDAGNLQALVQLKMLGQGYDFPAICVVVPMRPYGSFSECYQFIGRGIRVIQDVRLAGQVAPAEQILDVVYHAEFGIDDHIDTIYAENDMDPLIEQIEADDESHGEGEVAGDGGAYGQPQAEAFVLFEHGTVEERIVHGPERIEQARIDRERQALAQRYADYVRSTESPVSFEQYASIIGALGS
ncbi:MAG: DEAD/DEAH box helicase family protein [Actinobacteria bacterium]|nr:DEAD/DEAH box helicase family protein [Actinomycetota bacterium]